MASPVSTTQAEPPPVRRLVGALLLAVVAWQLCWWCIKLGWWAGMRHVESTPSVEKTAGDFIVPFLTAGLMALVSVPVLFVVSVVARQYLRLWPGWALLCVVLSVPGLLWCDLHWPHVGWFTNSLPVLAGCLLVTAVCLGRGTGWLVRGLLVALAAAVMAATVVDGRSTIGHDRTHRIAEWEAVAPKLWLPDDDHPGLLMPSHQDGRFRWTWSPDDDSRSVKATQQPSTHTRGRPRLVSRQPVTVVVETGDAQVRISGDLSAPEMLQLADDLRAVNGTWMVDNGY